MKKKDLKSIEKETGELEHTPNCWIIDKVNCSIEENGDEKMKRLLCILSNMNTGGAETFLMKLYREIDRTRYQMDFCVNSKSGDYYEKEIIDLGGRIYRIPSKSENLKLFKKSLFNIVKNNEYEYVLRVTSNAGGFLDLKIAKEAGAKVCVARSSNSNDAAGLKTAITHRVGKVFLKKYVDVKLAPSDLAAIYTFGRKDFEDNSVIILNNGIDLDFYKYREEGRSQIRNEFGIKEDEILCGHIGRFNKQKNHDFLIDIFSSLYTENQKIKLLLVGNGDLECEIRNKVARLGLSEKVIFAGVRGDIPDLLSAMDIFIFPSSYEGMPNTVIEAQACGLTCIISDSITRQVALKNNLYFESIKDSPESWARNIMKYTKCKDRDLSRLTDYDIKKIAKEFCSVVFEEERENEKNLSNDK